MCNRVRTLLMRMSGCRRLHRDFSPLKPNYAAAACKAIAILHAHGVKLAPVSMPSGDPPSLQAEEEQALTSLFELEPGQVVAMCNIESAPPPKICSCCPS
jgi:hypothetical protein